MLYFGTLQDLLKTEDELNGECLNVLDLPMGGAVVPALPQYRYINANPYHIVPDVVFRPPGIWLQTNKHGRIQETSVPFQA